MQHPLYFVKNCHVVFTCCECKNRTNAFHNYSVIHWCSIFTCFVCKNNCKVTQIHSTVQLQCDSLVCVFFTHFVCKNNTTACISQLQCNSLVCVFMCKYSTSTFHDHWCGFLLHAVYTCKIYLMNLVCTNKCTQRNEFDLVCYAQIKHQDLTTINMIL